MEEKFFFWYHLRAEPEISMDLPIAERKWYIQKFIQQKQKENDAMESSRRRAQSKH